MPKVEKITVAIAEHSFFIIEENNKVNRIIDGNEDDNTIFKIVKLPPSTALKLTDFLLDAIDKDIPVKLFNDTHSLIFNPKH